MVLLIIALLACNAAFLLALIVMVWRLPKRVGDLRRIWLQLQSVIGMLQRAGFKPRGKVRDWSDDFLKTQIRD